MFEGTVTPKTISLALESFTYLTPGTETSVAFNTTGSVGSLHVSLYRGETQVRLLDTDHDPAQPLFFSIPAAELVAGLDYTVRARSNSFPSEKSNVSSV